MLLAMYGKAIALSVFSGAVIFVLVYYRSSLLRYAFGGRAISEQFMRSTYRRRGLTLVEVLTVTAICGILIALLVPAVQRMRELASRTHCANNLRQLGTAFHAHHSVFNVLPGNGGGAVKPLKATDGSLFVPTTIQTANQSVTTFWSIGIPGASPQQQTGAWGYAILPYIGQEAVYRNLAWHIGIPLLTCPTRRDAKAKVAVDDEYGKYVGGGWAWAKTDYGSNPRVVRGRLRGRPLYTLAAIKDGASQTILLAEKVMNSRLYNSGTWYFDEPYFFANSSGSRRLGDQILQDGPDVILLDNWGSAHPSGAQFLFADGSLRVLRFGTPSTIVRALLTPTGGETLPAGF